MKELWKDIPKYEGLYQVSDAGRIKSFRQSSKYGNPTEYILKPSVSNNGYCQVTLYNGTTRKKFLVHRLVAIAFLPNPENLPQINHKDEVRTNNRVDNLEWCTALYNNTYGTCKIRAVETRSLPVEQLTLDGKRIAIYRSAKIAGELLVFSKQNIQRSCREGKVAHGYLWKYCPTF